MAQKKPLISRLLANRLVRLMGASVVAISTLLIGQKNVTGIGLFILTWTAFALTATLLAWLVIASFHPRDVKEMASKEDSTGSFIFLFVLTAGICSLAAIFLLLKSNSKGGASTTHWQMLLCFASVASSWLLVHTLFTLRYAHLYYGSQSIKKQNGETNYGLEFPEEEEPDYLDFAYFSFVVGMTFQVSDVQVTGKQIRRLVLLHGCLSFVYNTVILALSINIVSGLISK